MEIKENYLNIGCGNKFHEDWVNIDIVSYNPNVIEHNILLGLPFETNQFDAVYHSQVLEHIPKESAHSFIAECFRVLKPGGILRVVVPDLENIVSEYQKYLNLCIIESNENSEANYEWILLEMYDQTIRNHSGGLMAQYLQKTTITNEEYVLNRIGFVGKHIRKSYLEGNNEVKSNNTFVHLKTFVLKIGRNLHYEKIRKRILSFVLTKQELDSLQIGKFRLGGEIHYWMYDRHSLNTLLNNVGFINISVKTPFESTIPNWIKFELDVKEGTIYDPTSLFMEAQKPK